MAKVVGNFSDIMSGGVTYRFLYDILFIGLLFVSFWLLDKVQRPYNKLVLGWIVLCSVVALCRLSYMLWLFVQFAITQ